MEQLEQFLGRYQLVRVLGRGAMGVVYEGIDPKLNRQVAVKTILKSQLLDAQLAVEYSARFIREAQAVGRLNHPNIVTVFDFGNEADVAYLVMEFIRGKELKTYLDAGHVFGIDEAVAIVCDLLEALDYAHNNGIVHRDVKPANVMLDQNGRVKLTDFGVARLTDGAGQEGTRAGTMVGTPSYMSPEQIKGLPAGAQTDLFACGVLLYQCLSLQKPFVGDSEWDIWQKIVNDDPAPLSTYRQAIPAPLEAAILRALAKNPKERPATARAMIGELKAAIAGQAFDADATRIIRAPGAPAGRDDSAGLTRGRIGNQTGLQQSAPDQTTAVELEFWRSIKDSGDPEEFHLYLQRFSSGMYSDLARRKIAKLEGSISGIAPSERTMSGRNESTGAGAPGQADATRRPAPPADEATRLLTRPPTPAGLDEQETRLYAPAAGTRPGEPTRAGDGPALAGRDGPGRPGDDAADASGVARQRANDAADASGVARQRANDADDASGSTHQREAERGRASAAREPAAADAGVDQTRLVGPAMRQPAGRDAGAPAEPEARRGPLGTDALGANKSGANKSGANKSGADKSGVDKSGAPPLPRTPAQGAPGAGKKPVSLLLGGVAAVLAIGGAAFFMMSKDGPKPANQAAASVTPAPAAPASATAASATAAPASATAMPASATALAKPVASSVDGAAQSAPAASTLKPDAGADSRKPNKTSNSDMASKPQLNQKGRPDGGPAPAPAASHATSNVADETAGAANKSTQANPVKMKPPVLKQEIPSFANSSSPQAVRCNNIMQRAVLGEPITVQEEADLRKGCK